MQRSAATALSIVTRVVGGLCSMAFASKFTNTSSSGSLPPLTTADVTATSTTIPRAVLMADTRSTAAEMIGSISTGLRSAGSIAWARA